MPGTVQWVPLAPGWALPRAGTKHVLGAASGKLDLGLDAEKMVVVSREDPVLLLRGLLAPALPSLAGGCWVRGSAGLTGGSRSVTDL